MQKYVLLLGLIFIATAAIWNRSFEIAPGLTLIFEPDRYEDQASIGIIIRRTGRNPEWFGWTSVAGFFRTGGKPDQQDRKEP